MNNSEVLNQSDDQLLRVNDVAELTTLSKSCINLWASTGKFPPSLVLSKTVKVWRLRDIRSWMEGLSK